MSNEERWIVVDDYIPVDGNLRPVFSRGRDPNEIWAILLEKCFAKLHGSYQSMDGSYPLSTTNRLSTTESSTSKDLSKDLSWLCRHPLTRNPP